MTTTRNKTHLKKQTGIGTKCNSISSHYFPLSVTDDMAKVTCMRCKGFVGVKRGDVERVG